MLPEHFERPSIESLCAVLDGYEVGERLQYIREFIWRGGTLQLRTDARQPDRPLEVAYALTAEWADAVLEQAPSATGLVRHDRPVLEGRWVRGRSGYHLRIGIDLAVPTAMYVRSQWLTSHVPFVGRPPAQVAEALQVELTTYAHAFLDHFHPVPRATALASERLRRLGLAA